MYDLRHTRTHDLKCLLSSHLIVPFRPSLYSEGITTKARLENSRDSVISQCGIWFVESGRCEENLICEKSKAHPHFWVLPLACWHCLIIRLMWKFSPGAEPQPPLTLPVNYWGNPLNQPVEWSGEGSEVPLERNHVFVHIPAVTP